MKPPTKIRAVFLDWAGTTVDHGSIAPVLALQTLFRRHGIELAGQDARRDMGLLKRDHIQAILSLPNIRREWRAIRGREPGAEETGALYEEFGHLQMEILAKHSQVIGGVVDVVQRWQQKGLRIGSSTGYTRAMLAPILAGAAKSGYRPDASVCPDEAGAGRPAPWMLMRNAQILEVYPPSCCVKIGDTISDIEEGRNAGMWTIGITRTGNLIGLDAGQWEELPASEKRGRLDQAEATLRNAGAHFVAEDLPACERLLAEIERSLLRSAQQVGSLLGVSQAASSNVT